MHEPPKNQPAGFDPLIDDDDADAFDVRGVTDVDQARRDASVNVKVNAPGAEPWDRYDPNEKPLPHPISLRLNRYDRALLRHLASWDEGSVQKAAQRLIRAGALRAIANQERSVKRAGKKRAS